MEEYKPSDRKQYERPELQDRPAAEETPRETQIVTATTQRTASTREIVEGHLKERARRATRRKWGGRGLVILGAAITLGSCPPYAFSLIGPQTIMIGLAMIAGGSALLAWRPKLKHTNEALLVAMKYGNSLTATRLALEMDVSFEKAEKIMRELVRSGVAEIDLDQKDLDQGITYKIKGL
jgi:predicted transcriptional regulator